MITKRSFDLFTAFLVSGLVLMAAFTPAGATTMRRMDLPEVVTKADRVVHAVAVEERVYWDRGRIFTDTTFEVLENIKGLGSPRVTVTMQGGNLDGWDMRIEGTPIFQQGEEVILFTSPRPGGSKNLIGFSQGLMRIVEDPVTGNKLARSFMPTGVTYIDKVSGQATEVRRNPREAPLNAMKDEIRRLVDSKESSPLIEKRVLPVDGALQRRVP